MLLLYRCSLYLTWPAQRKTTLGQLFYQHSLENLLLPFSGLLRASLVSFTIPCLSFPLNI